MLKYLNITWLGSTSKHDRLYGEVLLHTQTAEGSSIGWFVGILWILQSESFLEVAMIFQIIPILLVPLQIIFNNVLEEVLSWVFGKQTLPPKNLKNIGAKLESG